MAALVVDHYVHPDPTVRSLVETCFASAAIESQSTELTTDSIGTIGSCRHDKSDARRTKVSQPDDFSTNNKTLISCKASVTKHATPATCMGRYLLTRAGGHNTVWLKQCQ